MLTHHNSNDNELAGKSIWRYDIRPVKTKIEMAKADIFRVIMICGQPNVESLVDKVGEGVAIKV